MSARAAAARWRRFRDDRRGNVLVEAAFGMVILIGLISGGVEVARYVLLQQKLDRTAMTVGDLVSRGTLLTEAEVANIFAAVPHLVQPFDFGSEGRVVLSAVRREDGGAAEVVWQRFNDQGLAVESRLGVLGEAASLPEGLTPQPNENLFIAEVFFDFEPMFGSGLLGAHRLYHRSVYRARLSEQVITQ
ncbi:MAG: hypothetical protein WD100_12820 [Tistlia sp.]